MPVSAQQVDQEEENEPEGERGAQAARGEHERAVSGDATSTQRLAATTREYASRRQRARTALTTTARWEPLGPASAGGRMTAITFHPTQASIGYAGAASGGVFRTTDAGATWEPLTDELPNLTVGALALAPSSPSTLYLGTGEGSWPGLYASGIGLFRSTDGGATWTPPARAVASQFFRISVHPQKPAVLVAGTDAGALRSTDGGATFTVVIDRASYGLVTGLVRDAARPETLYAATWCPDVVPCSVGARVLKSTDDGASWTVKSNGLDLAVGADRDNMRIALAISASDPRVLYAAYGLEQGGINISHIYKTADGGETWADLPSVSHSTDAGVRGYMVDQTWYDNALAVSPSSPDVVVAGAVQLIRSTDGGRTFSRAAGAAVHRDIQELRYSGRTLWIATDGGLYQSDDDAQSAAERNAGLATRQYQSLAVDPARPDHLLAGALDNGTDQAVGSSFRAVLGQDGFACAVNPRTPEIAYATTQYGKIYRTTSATSSSPVFTDVTPSYEAAGERAPFATVLALDQEDPSRLLTGAQRLWESTDGGSRWSALPTATADGSTWNEQPITAVAARGAVVLVAKSPDIYRSTDGGRTWVRTSRGLTGQRINGLEVDPRSPSVAWAALAAATGTGIFLTTDGGGTWTPRGNGLPEAAAHVVRADPGDSAVVLAGNDVGVFRSTDQGASWSRFGTGLPSVPVRDLKLVAGGAVLAATHGRGLWRLALTTQANRAPAALITSPQAPSLTISGGSLNFTGVVSDPDGDAVTATWTFGDTGETVPAAAGSSTVSHAFQKKGVFPVSLTARDASGALSTAAVVVVTVSGDGSGPRWLMAGMAYTQGAGGTFWQSDFAVFNPHPTDELVVSLAFLDGRAGSGAASASLRWYALTVAPRETLSFPNVLARTPFALPAGSYGALLVRGDRVPVTPVLTGRTYSTGGEGGTFGLSLPAVALPSGLLPLADAPRTDLLVGLRELPGISRTNLVLANVGAEPASARIRLLDAGGRALGAPLVVELSPWGVRQLNRVLSTPAPEGAGISFPVATFVASVETVSGVIYPYATVIDERSSDPVLVAPAPHLSPSYRLPGVVRTAGKAGTFFVSDVLLHNPAARSRAVSLRYLYRVARPGEPASAEQTAVKTLDVAAGETRELVDFVKAMLGSAADGGSFASATLEVAADGAEPLVVAARTYNAQPGGNVGFQVPGYTLADGAASSGPSRSLVLAGLTSNGSYRTNAAFFLLGEGEARGIVKAVDRAGRVLSSHALALGPGTSFAQWNDGDLFGIQGEGLAVVLELDGGAAPVGGYATLIDNVSGDSVLVPGQVSETR